MSSLLATLGLRIGTLGSATDLAIAAPLAGQPYSQSAHTAPTRTGLYFSRQAGQERTGIVVEGAEVLRVGASGLQVGSSLSQVWTALTLNPATFELVANRNQPNGYAGLDSFGRVPLSQLPTITGLTYLGMWNASLNFPTLSSGAAGYPAGQYWLVSQDGLTNLDGTADWGVGDWVVSNGTAWQKIDNSESNTVRASLADPTPGFLTSKVDGVTIGVVANQLSVLLGGLSVPASQITVLAGGFSGQLAVTDTNVQLALNRLDQHRHDWRDLLNVTSSTTAVAISGTVLDSFGTATPQGVYRWLVRFRDGAVTQACEILSSVVGMNQIDYTVLPSTRDFPHQVRVDKSGATVQLILDSTPSVGLSVDTVRWSWN